MSFYSLTFLNFFLVLLIQKELEVFEQKKKSLSREVQEFSSKCHDRKSALIELKNKVKLLDIELRAKSGRTQTIKSEVSVCMDVQITRFDLNCPLCGILAALPFC